MSLFDDLAAVLAAQPDPARAVEALLEGLAARIKATSNDQNIQKLAHALRLDAAPLAAAVEAKRRT